MSNDNFFNKTFIKNPAIFIFLRKPSLDCTLTKNVKPISNLNNSKTTRKKN